MFVGNAFLLSAIPIELEFTPVRSAPLVSCYTLPAELLDLCDVAALEGCGLRK